MVDVFSKKKRSEIMSRIRSENTQAEKIAFSFLRSKGIYFQRHYKMVIGSPDIALPKKKKAVFIDGDFWHGYKFSKIKSRLPKEYWRKKIEDNIKRDKFNRSKLRRSGWKVLRVWEHEIDKQRDESFKKIIKFLK